MNISTKFYEADFRSETPKAAYLKACEFVAKHVLSGNSKVEVDKVTWQVKRTDDRSVHNLPTFQLTLFYVYDEEVVNEQNCKVCKEAHHSYFINENFNCNRCNKSTYRLRMEEKIGIGADYFNKLLGDELNKF